MSAAAVGKHLQIEQIRTEINTQLFEIIEQIEVHKEIKDVIFYNITSGGKRWRPLLTFALIRDINNQEPDRKTLQQILSLELLHIASLIHDDLPALDNDDFRRGIPTTHKVYGEGVSLLIGDLLVGVAYSLTSENIKQGPQLVKILSRAWMSLCEGQILDINPEKFSKEEIDRKKTGALFVACAEYAGSFSELSHEETEALKNFGNIFGATYQAQDDAQDEPESKDNYTLKTQNLLKNLEMKLLEAEKTVRKQFTYTRKLLQYIFEM